MIYWTLAAATIVAILMAIAGYYLVKLHRQQRRNRARWVEMATESERQRQRINNSIQLLAGAIGKDELTLTEASIRICGLLDSLQISGEVAEEYVAFYRLRAATAHIPILEQWRALDRREQFRFDLERQTLEREYRESVVEAAERIRGRHF